MSSIPSSFLVSASAGYLGSYLTTVYAPTGDNFSILAGGGTSPQKATVDALATGKMTNGENKVLTAIAHGPSSGTSAPWNKNNTEPTTLANLRSFGWIKLVKKTKGTGGTTQGVYELTNVGKAVYARTSGGAATGSGAANSSAGTITSAAENSDQAAAASATSTLSSLVSTATGVLSSLGINISA